MKSRATRKEGHMFDIIIEKCLEWWEHLFYTITRGGREWKSNLVEAYHIYSDKKEAPYVQEYLEARKKALLPSKYQIKIEEIAGKSDKNIVGTASLYRKKRLISRATLKTKESDSPEHKLIYWEFN